MSYPLSRAARITVFVASLFTTYTYAAAEDQNKLCLMSINMWHKDRPRELKAMAENLRADLPRVPDFVLCQEVVFERSGPEKNTAEVLGNYLGYHCRGTKRTSDSEGIAIISRFPFEHYESLHLKAQTSALLLGFNRVSVMGEFKVPNVGRVRVVDVHLTNWDFEHHIRRRQIRETLDWVAARQKQAPAVMTILGGDFNAKIHWAEMQQVLDSQPLKFANNNGAELSQGLRAGHPDKRIDFIFLSAPDGMTKFEGERLLWKSGLYAGDDHFYPSDHLAVVHQYTLRTPPIHANTGE